VNKYTCLFMDLINFYKYPELPYIKGQSKGKDHRKIELKEV